MCPGMRKARLSADYPCQRRNPRSEEHTSELQSQSNLVCRLLLEKKKKKTSHHNSGKTADRPPRQPQSRTPTRTPPTANKHIHSGRWPQVSTPRTAQSLTPTRSDTRN